MLKKKKELIQPFQIQSTVDTQELSKLQGEEREIPVRNGREISSTIEPTVTKKDPPFITPKEEESGKEESNETIDTSLDDAYYRTIADLQNITKPTYSNSYNDELTQLYNKIIGREDFSYNVNEDSLYKQYADQYIQQGRLAQQDAMGQASALTGGYANSYAQSVGQQTYQGYIQGLNNIVPELYNQALTKYTQEGQDLINQYAVTKGLADDEYAKYQDEVNKYYQDISYAQSLKNATLGEVSSLLAMGAEPTEQQIKASGLTTEQYNAMKTYLTSATVTEGREAVSSMSSKELVEAMEGFAMTGKETGYKELLVFLEDCTKTGRLTDEEAANYWYELTGQQRPSFD